MIHIIDHRELEIKKPIFIYGVGGGMGNVAKLVALKLLKKYKAKKLKTFIIYAYPDIVYANEQGILKHLKLDLYHFSHDEKDYLVLYGEVQPNVQPFDIPARFEVAKTLLQLLQTLETKKIISVGGYGVNIEPDDPKLYFAGNNKKLLNKLKEKIGKDFNLYKNSNIVGLSGLIVSMARLFRIPAYIVLAETYPTAEINGYFGAKKVLELFKKLYGFDVNLKDYEEKGKKIKEEITKQLRPQKPQKQERKDIYYFG